MRIRIAHRHHMRRTSAVAAAFVALALISTPADSSVFQRARYLMGTVCEVAVGGPVTDAQVQIDAAFDEAQRIEALLSTWTDTSELARLNRGEEVRSPELEMLLDSVAGWEQRTNGAFNARIKPLVDLWRTRQEGTLPSAEAIESALAARQAADKRRAGFEEGGFGKGYAIDRMLERIAAEEVMINFGGQIAVRGALTVTIADPEARDHPVLAFELRDASLSTSSGSEKTFEADGRRFSHIIDPRSGEALPPRGSVSVISANAMAADILSTALYVMGESEGLDWANANGVAALFISPQRQIRLSAKAREHVRELELLDRNFSVKE